jgi:hypothetical protein
VVVGRLLNPNHLNPTIFFSYFYSPGGMSVCLCIHWVVQNTKQHPFLIRAGSLYTIWFFWFLGHFESFALLEN